MKLKTCLEIAEDCGLETVGEALFNIELHATSLFPYSEINKELAELHLAFEAAKISTETKVEEILAGL